MATLRKKDWLILSGLGLLLCCGGGTALGLNSPDAAPEPAVTTAPPLERIADLPAEPAPTPTVDQVAVEASRSAASERAETLAKEKAAKEKAEKAEKKRAEQERKKQQQEARQAEEEARKDEDDEGSTSVYYKNCTAVRAAGADPIRRGDPGYAGHLDRDGDGVGCE